MEHTTTAMIVDVLTRAIARHRLRPGAKLAEQKLANHFGVSRTLVRQALFQLSQNRLVTLSPARGAFVSSPSAEETRQVFAVRRALEIEMTRSFARSATPAHIQVLREHVAAEQSATREADVANRTELLGDFHVQIAELLGNTVLAQVLRDLISRCSLATLMYQSDDDALDSSAEHEQLLEAFAQGNVTQAVKLMRQHLQHVENSLDLDRPPPPGDLADALEESAQRLGRI